MSRATGRPERSNSYFAVVVSKADAQSVLSTAIDSGVLDKTRKVLCRDGMVEIPVVGQVPGHGPVLQESPVFYRRTLDLAEVLAGQVPVEKLQLLPSGWYIVGQTVVVKIHPALQAYKKLIGSALLKAYPRCCCVLADAGIEGQLREPQREVIAGSAGVTIHRENGVVFKLDPMRIMFSPGNLPERTRMSRLGLGERVVDMFAGIGYFSIPMAVHSRPIQVLAIELNPVAFGYLVENVRLNRVGSIVRPVLGDCAIQTPHGWADRVIMGMVGITDRYLPFGIRALVPGGVLHYHQTLPSWLYPDHLIAEVICAAEAQGRRAEILQCSRVKKYAPGVLHAVLDVRID